MRKQEIDAALEQPGIARSGHEREPLRCPLPLPDESFECLVERNAQGLSQSAKCIVFGSTKRQSDRECGTSGKIEPTRQSDITVKGRVVLPIEAIIVSQVGPAVIHAHITAGTLRERNCGANHHPCIAFMGS